MEETENTVEDTLANTVSSASVNRSETTQAVADVDVIIATPPTLGMPWALFAFGVVLCIWFLFLYAKQARATIRKKLGDANLVVRLTASLSRPKRQLKQTLWLLAATFLVLGLARPQWGTREQLLSQQGLEVMMVLDVSYSMLAQDIAPNRLRRAKLDIAALMDRLEGDSVGLVVFSGASFIQFPLTSDINTAKQFLQDSNTNMISRPGTAIGDALLTALSGFSKDISTSKVVILFSDSEQGDTRNTKSPTQAAQELAKQNVRLFTVGVGTAEGAPIPIYNSQGQRIGYKKDVQGQQVVSKLDANILMELAQSTEGQYVDASKPNALNKLVTVLAGLERRALSEQRNQTAIERFQYPLAVALLLWVLAEWLSERSHISTSYSKKSIKIAKSEGLIDDETRATNLLPQPIKFTVNEKST